MKDLSLHMLDIVQNSIRASADQIQISLTCHSGFILRFEVADNGQGMNQEQLNMASDPFFTTRSTRRIGLGIALLKQKAEQAGGELVIYSETGRGTTIHADFQTHNPDFPPLGDFPGCAWMLMVSNPALRIIFRLISSDFEAQWDSQEIQQAMDGINLTNSTAREGILDWFTSDFSTFKDKISRN